MRLSYIGNRALILGGSADLAIFLAGALLEVGITPVLTYRNEKGLNKIRDSLTEIFERVLTLMLDFSRRETLDNLADGRLKAVDYVVDFAQPDYERLIASADIDDIYAFFEASVSFRAALLRRVGRMMLERKRGRLVFVSSTAAARPNPGQGFYASAKLASEALYKSMGLELGARGITSVVLRPGYVDAGRGRRYMQWADSQRVLNRLPLKRAVSPEEISHAVLFLLSNEAASFNATEVCVDGGLLAGK